MNSYNLLASKLRAMQVQGFKKSEIIEAWRVSLPDALKEMEQLLFLAKLKSNRKEIKLLKSQIQQLKNLNKTIKIGLLE